ncbi:MAG: transcription termination/antitermination protein NusA [Caedimonas sp.]|nr:transcription termination/antitermination protein NusA [Caedimonas sp.]
MTIITSGTIRTEILGVADMVAREKGIDREEVIEAMEIAIQKASRVRYGMERDIRATIDRKTGEISLYACREVVNDVENEVTQISLDEAKTLDLHIKVGEFIKEPLPPIDLGRVAAQTAKQVIFQRVRDAERQRQYNEYKNRVGEIINGQVKRVEFGNVMVELGQSEALLARDQLIPRENFRPGDRIRAYIMDVRQEPRGPQVFLSRVHPGFMAKLFAQEVPEIYEGVIELKAVARDPGSRAKIAVSAADKSLDPVGACVGMRGSRVQAVTSELQGEKVDIIPWSSNPAVFVVNALVPAEASKVVLDEETRRVEVVVPDDQLSLAIGRRGQNVRLASLLTGWGIDVISDSNESDRRSAQLKNRSRLFVEALDVDDVLAHLLVTEGFTTVEEIAYISLEDLMAIEGFEEELAHELKSRAQAYLEKQDAEFVKQFELLGVDKSLTKFSGLTPKMLVLLGQNSIKTLDDFADLATDELCELFPDLSKEEANQMIMEARKNWFKV